jgi:hypothetical protein
MKTVSRRHCTLSVCAAAAILAGCGGATQPSVLNGTEQNTAMNTVSATRLSSESEALTTTDVAVTPSCPSSPGASFNASGTATGPYPGTFTASGLWRDDQELGPHHWLWVFRESIKIVSNTLTIHVHIKHKRGSRGPSRFINCDSFGGLKDPIVMKYKGTYSGTAEVEIVQQGDLSETLDGL